MHLLSYAQPLWLCQHVYSLLLQLSLYLTLLHRCFLLSLFDIRYVGYWQYRQTTQYDLVSRSCWRSPFRVSAEPCIEPFGCMLKVRDIALPFFYLGKLYGVRRDLCPSDRIHSRLFGSILEPRKILSKASTLVVSAFLPPGSTEKLGFNDRYDSKHTRDVCQKTQYYRTPSHIRTSWTMRKMIGDITRRRK